MKANMEPLRREGNKRELGVNGEEKSNIYILRHFKKTNRNKKVIWIMKTEKFNMFLIAENIN